MFGFVLTYVALVDEILWWCTLYRLRQEAREAADRLEWVIQQTQIQEVTRGG